MTGTVESTTAVTYGAPQLRELIDHIADGAIGRDERDELPYEAIAALKAARFGALRIPAARGGGNASLVELFKAFIELSAADSNVAHIVRSHFGVVENLLRSSRAEDARWLERVTRGELIGSASTELGAKAGATDLPYRTTITHTPNGLRLNGTKHYTTGGLYMDWLIVGATDLSGGAAAGPSGTRLEVIYRATFFHIQLSAMIAGMLRRIADDAVDW